MPEGPAWGAIVDPVYKYLNSFGPDDRPLLVGLLLSGTFGNACRTLPSRERSRRHALLIKCYPPRGLTGIYSDELNQSLTEIILQVPKAVEKKLFQRVRISLGDDRWHDHRPSIAVLLLNYYKAEAVARDFPDLVIDLSKLMLV